MNKMNKMCANCPFASKGPGLHLRKSLMPGRWRGIITGILRGEIFFCHKTTDDDDAQDEDCDYYRPTGKEQECFGAVKYIARQWRR